MGKLLARSTASSLPLLVALAALLVWGGRDVQEPWGTTSGPAFSQAQITEWSNAIITEQTAALGCTPNPHVTPRVAVRNATGFDRGVVRVLPLTDAFEQAKAGTIWVVGYCD